MRQVMVRYKVKPGRADANRELVRAGRVIMRDSKRPSAPLLASAAAAAVDVRSLMSCASL